MTKRERPKKVEKTMEFMYLDPRVLKDNPNNYNTHPDSQIVTLANSMVALGFNKPVVVDENFVILAGHGAVLSAIYNQENDRVFESEGSNETFDTIPVVVRRGLTDVMKRAYLIGDNELAKMSVADEEVLEQQLLILEHVGFDLTLVGEFDSYELDEPVVVEKELDIEVKEPAYKIVINCTSAQHQDEVEADLSARGFDCHRVQV